jgi:hypothetical protein
MKCRIKERSKKKRLWNSNQTRCSTIKLHSNAIWWRIHKSITIGLGSFKESECIEFNSLIVAEGENSATMKNLGFKKTVDKFNQAIGLVINLFYERENVVEKRLKSFVITRFSPNWQEMELGKLNSLGIACENIEYLKGSTHYIVVTIDKKSLLNFGVLIRDAESSANLLVPENINLEKLFEMGRLIAEICQIPKDAKFFSHNPVQIFDFSSRSRCYHPVKMLYPEFPFVFQVPDSKFSLASTALIGDALMEPFWPQGLGVNRGFHAVLDSVYSMCQFFTKDSSSLLNAFESRNFFYRVTYGFSFNRGIVRPFEEWSINPEDRYAVRVLESLRLELRS